MYDRYIMKLLLTLCTSILLSGCAAVFPNTTPIGSVEDFGASEVYSRVYPGSSKSTCDASRRALLSQGYIIEEEQPAVKAQKNFQPGPENHIQVRFTVTCVDNSKGSNTTTMFVNAVKDRYSLRKSSNSASVGIPALASFSLPLTSTDDSMVKVASETVSSKKFYTHFFETVDRFVNDIEEPEETPKRPNVKQVKPEDSVIEKEEVLGEKQAPPVT